MNGEMIIAAVKPLLTEAEAINAELATMLDAAVASGDVRAVVGKAMPLRTTRDDLRTLALTRLQLAAAEYEREHGEAFPWHSDTVEGCIQAIEKAIASRAEKAERDRQAKEAAEQEARERQEAQRKRDEKRAEEQRRQEASKARAEAAIAASESRRRDVRASAEKAAAELERLAQAHRARTGT